MITLSPNEQNSSLVRTCSVLVTLSRPSNVRNFTSIPPPSSNNQLHECSAEYLSYPPYTYGINYHIPPTHISYLDFDQVNYTQDLGSFVF